VALISNSGRALGLAGAALSTTAAGCGCGTAAVAIAGHSAGVCEY
jgi:hypothetical protein